VTESVLVTGTTSGVGRALLERYVQRGAKVICVNRRRVPELEARYPDVRFECIDVRSTEQVDGLLRSLARSDELPQVLVLNAGINRVDNDESFDLADYKAVLETNLYGVLNFVQPLTELPPGSRPRRLIAVSSMASYIGNPYALGYSTSKRALTSCFASWSKMYAGTDLIFQRVMLGPVLTPMYTMQARLPAWMGWIKNSFSATPDGAAAAIARFAVSRRPALFYPWRALPLYAGMWLSQALLPGFFRGRKTLAGAARRREARRHEASSEV
jgi:NAD(P)-dependent dehydrogenase (short-subunit alcohol dehydrogenase family)